MLSRKHQHAVRVRSNNIETVLQSHSEICSEQAAGQVTCSGTATPSSVYVLLSNTQVECMLVLITGPHLTRLISIGNYTGVFIFQSIKCTPRCAVFMRSCFVKTS